MFELYFENNSLKFHLSLLAVPAGGGEVPGAPQGAGQEADEDNEPQTLHQQENMSIKGQSARYLVMQVSDACRTFTLCLGCCNYDLKSKK